MTVDLSKFYSWAKENEIKWEEDAIEIREGKHGLGVFAKKDLELGYPVLEVPKSAILSTKTTGIANLLEEEGIEGYVSLTIACMYELSRGEQSPWSAYLALLTKRTIQMATSLPQESRDMMKGAEVYKDLELDLKDLKEDYEQIVQPFIEKNTDIFTEAVKKEFFTIEAYNTWAALVSSRCMDVDAYHCEAMVPFADFVNHSSDPSSEFLAYEDVCDICGEIICEHLDNDDSDEDDEEEEEDDDDEAPELEVKKDEKDEKKEKKEGEDDSDDEWEDDGDEVTDTCDIVAERDVKKGEEITRFYGPYPNKVLLSKYGFAEIENPHDTVTVQVDMIRQVAEEVLGDKAVVEERLEWFLKNEDTFMGDLDDEDEEGGCCDHDHADGEEHHHHEHHHKKKGDDKKDEEKKEGDEEEEEEEEEDDFPRDIMYLLADGHVDDRLYMLVNTLLMPKDKFEQSKEDPTVAMDYFGDIFVRRELEKPHHEDAQDQLEEVKADMAPMSEEAKHVKKQALEMIVKILKLRADAYSVSDKTTAESDLETLKKANLSGPLFYGGICVVGEKAILQKGAKVCQALLEEI
ncbi:hypothetical protein DFQ26_007108 [Actinomortierella ambigua]|nr:hypothetical protein DFQ26_007108 [Actinomortierella ambigua]